MDGSRLRLTGTGEGFDTRITTVLSGADSPAKVMEALRTLFPDIDEVAMVQSQRWVNHPTAT